MFAIVSAVICAVVTPAIAQVDAPAVGSIPIIDVHNQYDGSFSHDAILERMNGSGISRMILSPHANAIDSELISFGQKHPDRLTIAVRTKTTAFESGKSDSVVGQIMRPEYGGTQEILFWHQAKPVKINGKEKTAGEWNLDIESPFIQQVISAIRARGWPVMTHYEFNGSQSKSKTQAMMKKFENVLERNLDLNFGLVHRGQLDANETRRLIETHPNIFCVLSESAGWRQEAGMTSVFNEGGMLATEWRNLFLEHPDKFVLSFDAPFGQLWTSQIPHDTSIWRRTLQRLPPVVGHKLGHENAERLWKLPPTQPISMLAGLPEGSGGLPKGKKGKKGPAE